MPPPPDPAPDHAPPRRGALAALLGLGLAACLGYTAVEHALLDGVSGWPLDDSWIHLVFARSLATGGGLAVNAGEPVAGSTAPLWTALLSLLAALPGGPLLPVKLAGVALTLAGIHATWTLGTELGLSAGAVTLGTGLTAASAPLVWSALSGLEIPLFVLLSLWGTILHLRERQSRERAPRSLAVLAAAALARPEGLLLLALAFADRALVWRRRDGDLALAPASPRRLAAGLGLALLILVPVALFNLWASGSVLPTTFAAKAAGARGWLPETRYLHSILAIFFRPQPVATLAVAAGVVTLVSRLGGARDRGLLPALWLVALPLAYSAISPRGAAPLAGSFGRYFFPLFPFLCLLGALGLERAGRALGPALAAGRARLPVRALLLAALLAPTAFALVEGAGRYAQSVDNVEQSDVRVARWLAGRLEPEHVLAVNDLGAIKYLLPGHRVLDLAGIAHPEAVAAGRAGLRRFLERGRPDFLVVFPEWYPELFAAGSGFTPLARFDVPANITMGGDRVVVASTPWTRSPLRRPEVPPRGTR